MFHFVCGRVRQNLLDYSADRLTAQERATIEQHLNSCAACRNQAAEYRQTLTLTEKGRQQPMPPSQTTWHSLRTQLETAPHNADIRTKRTGFAWCRGWITSSVVAAGVAGLLLCMPQQWASFSLYLPRRERTSWSLGVDTTAHRIGSQGAISKVPFHKLSTALLKPAAMADSARSVPQRTLPPADQKADQKQVALLIERDLGRKGSGRKGSGTDKLPSTKQTWDKKSLGCTVLFSM